MWAGRIQNCRVRPLFGPPSRRSSDASAADACRVAAAALVNLAHVVADGAIHHPDRTALLFEDERISYRDLDCRAAVAAAALRAQGIEADDRVAIKLPNTPDYVAAYFGVLRLGAIAVPLNVLLAQPEIDAGLETATPKACVDRPLPRRRAAR